jgi:hypothetical protein
MFAWDAQVERVDELAADLHAACRLCRRESVEPVPTWS